MPGAQKEGPAPCAIPAQSTAASANQVRITSSYCNPRYKTSFTSTSNIFFPRNPPTINYLKKLPQPRPPKSLYPLVKSSHLKFFLRARQNSRLRLAPFSPFISRHSSFINQPLSEI